MPRAFSVSEKHKLISERFHGITISCGGEGFYEGSISGLKRPDYTGRGKPCFSVRAGSIDELISTMFTKLTQPAQIIRYDIPGSSSIYLIWNEEFRHFNIWSHCAGQDNYSSRNIDRT